MRNNNTCEACPVGTYFASDSCVACQRGSTSIAGSTSCFVDPEVLKGTSPLSAGPCKVLKMTAPSSSNTGIWRLVEGLERDGSPVYQRDGNGRYLVASGSVWKVKSSVDGGWFNTFARNSLFPADANATGYTLRCQCQEGEADTNNCDCAASLVSQGGYCRTCESELVLNATSGSCEACPANAAKGSDGVCSVPACATWDLLLTSGGSKVGWFVCSLPHRYDGRGVHFSFMV